MTITIARPFAALYEPLSLSPGNHKSPDEGLCAMEAAAWLAGLPHSDRPQCTSEIIAAYIRHLNDHMPDDERGRLIAYLPQIIGIPGDDWDHLRNELFAWHAVHIFAPAALRHLGYEEYARTLEEQFRFYEAEEATKAIAKELGHGPPEKTPVTWAALRAGKAASLASWFTSKRNHWLKGQCGDTHYGSCAEAAAGAAFYASLAGCENIWGHALFTLEEVVAMGREKDSPEPIAHS